MINEPLLQRVLDYIAAHPEEHNQDRWVEQGRCGTVACMAGHTVLLTGHEVAWEGVSLPSGGGTRESAFVVGTDGIEEIDEVAARELGLTETQGLELFYEAEDLDDLWEIAAEMTEGRVHP